MTPHPQHVTCLCPDCRRPYVQIEPRTGRISWWQIAPFWVKCAVLTGIVDAIALLVRLSGRLT